MKDLPRIILAATIFMAVAGTCYIAISRNTDLSDAALAVVSALLGSLVTYFAITEGRQ